MSAIPKNAHLWTVVANMNPRTGEYNGDPFALVKVRATWAGRSVTETGTYSKKEMLAQRRPYNLSHMIATAITRANNRSVAAIIGGGEVSAEEIEESE